MNETRGLQKQDLSHINYSLDKIIELLKRIIELLETRDHEGVVMGGDAIDWLSYARRRR